MPAQRLGTEPVDIRQYDVVGLDAGPATPHFVRHLALAADSRTGHAPPDPLPLTHMGPPLAVGEGGHVVHVHGTIPPGPDHAEQVGLFVEETRAEYAAHQRRGRDQYCVHPHVSPVVAADGTVVTHRYSCAGFVVEAYRAAGVDLVVTDEARLPGATLDARLAAYPDFHSVLTNPAQRARRAGLHGDGPWPVVLPGYVLHALNRPTDDIRAGPHLPQPGDECFPRRSTAA